MRPGPDPGPSRKAAAENMAAKNRTGEHLAPRSIKPSSQRARRFPGGFSAIDSQPPQIRATRDATRAEGQRRPSDGRAAARAEPPRRVAGRPRPEHNKQRAGERKPGQRQPAGGYRLARRRPLPDGMLAGRNRPAAARKPAWPRRRTQRTRRSGPGERWSRPARLLRQEVSFSFAMSDGRLPGIFTV